MTCHERERERERESGGWSLLKQPKTPFFSLLKSVNDLQLSLYLACGVNILAHDILKYLFYFIFPGKRIWHFMQNVSLGFDISCSCFLGRQFAYQGVNLSEMSKCVFRGKYFYESIIEMSSAELAQRVVNARLCLFYKVVNGLVAVPLPDYIQPRTHRISKYCHSMTFRQIHTGKDSYKYSFFPLAIVQWNTLPETAVTSPSLDSFKAEIEKLQFPKP